ncbi:putative multicopper oxidase family protein [Lyophyllum shimeji]|uniref:Multicopper oxidase family protein n=1 Tax=Lyophyllum shimeji TaxID=47721 RepID=A0A9P3PS51_LYOSH|nr:putative multicopper oxidase family protein [Lyophyllum shimeji]
MLSLLLFALSTLILAPVISGSRHSTLGPQAQLTVANHIIAPDGYKRSAVLVNGQYPAPQIRAMKGTRYLLNVVNELTDKTMQRSTSVHFHGIFQRGTPYADGTSIVSQCPITPGKSFLHDFNVLDEAGTYWYHSHFRTQYCDGLRGPFIIYDPLDPHRGRYDVDDESTVITVGEWYHEPSPAIVINGNPSGNSTLINGKGRYVGGPKVPLAVVNVQRHKRYRIRLLSISCDPFYIFEIDGHRLTLIEVEGSNTHPYTIDNVMIHAGQRYSFVLHANQPVGNYWIRALPSSGFNNLRCPIADPVTKQKVNGVRLSEANIRPLNNAPAPGKPFPGGADVTLNFNIAVNATNRRYMMNGVSWEDPSVPVLLQILSGARDPRNLLPHGSVYTLPRNKVVEITLPNNLTDTGNPHPFHLHGHAFYVIQSAGNTSMPNYINPPRRDTISLGQFESNVTIRFLSDNPGPWFLHCHINWHLQRGLAVVFAEDPWDVPNETKYTQAWTELCPTYNELPLPLQNP